MLLTMTKTPQFVLHYCGYSLYPISTCPVEILLNNVEQNLQSGQLHHWATSDGAEITTSLFAVIQSSRGIWNPFRGIIIQPFRELIQPFRVIV